MCRKFNRIIKIFLNKENIKVDLIVKKNVKIYSFENELSHVFLNIISNSKDALINNISKDNRVIRVIVNSKKDFVFVNISDNGGGIPPLIMPKIFEPYYTTKYKSAGTGIGLYMSKQIIEKHIKGQISCKNIEIIINNQKYDGTSFLIKIPINKEIIEEKRKKMNKNLDILKNINILYLEDDENLLKHTSDILEDFVANIYGVKNTIDAMKILLEKKVDVIISDILLENENGINFLKYIKSKDILIPAILTTAHTDTNYLIESIKLKVENYLLKPINIDELLNSLYDVILPKIQEKEIKKNSNIIKTIGAITDSKQVEIIKYIFNNLDENNNFFGSYSEIMEQFSISKPTLIKLFKDLADKNILIKISHKTYQFDEKSLND